MGLQCVVYATPEEPEGPERVLGIVREERQARRICQAIGLGPTGFKDARYERFDDQWTQHLDGLDLGLQELQKTAKPAWRTERTHRADRLTHAAGGQPLKVTGDATGTCF